MEPNDRQYSLLLSWCMQAMQGTAQEPHSVNRTSLPADTPRKALPDMIQSLMMWYAQERVSSSLFADELQPIQLAAHSIMPHRR